MKLIILNICSHLLRLISFFFQCFHNLVFMFRTIGFQRDPKFNGGISVDGDKLIMLQLNYIPVYIRDYTGNSAQLARFIRQKYGHGKNPVPHNQALLYHGGHGDHIHISAA